MDDTTQYIIQSIITKRLIFYVEAVDLLPENQAGFRAGYSTVDNAFVLYSIVNKYLNTKRKPVYVAFVDFKRDLILLIIPNASMFYRKLT